MQIVEERAGDETAIHALTEAAFAGKPRSEQTEPTIIDALRAADALTVSLVAVDCGAVIGHVAFSPIMIDGIDRGWFGLGPVSVAPDRQCAGIGSRLILEGLERLRKRDARGCVVLGDPDFYRRFGFVPDAKLTYGDMPPEYFQALPFGEHDVAGAVEYHIGFAAR